MRIGGGPAPTTWTMTQKRGAAERKRDELTISNKDEKRLDNDIVDPEAVAYWAGARRLCLEDGRIGLI